MKKLLIVCFLFLGVIGIAGTTVHAEDTEVDVTQGVELEEGLTPDSEHYQAEKLMEKISLGFTANKEKRAEKKIEYAKERLAEAMKMKKENKIQLFTEMMNEYGNKLDEASDEIAGLMMKNKNKEKLHKMEAELDGVIIASDEIEDELSDDQKEKLVETKRNAYMKANVIEGIEESIVVNLKENYNLGLGEISKIVKLSEMTEETIEAIVNKYEELGKDFGELSRFYNITMQELNAKAAEDKSLRIEERLQKALEDGNEELIEKYQNQLIKNEFKNSKDMVNDSIKEAKENLLTEYGVGCIDDLTEEQREEFNQLIKEIREELKIQAKIELRENVSNMKGSLNKIKNNHKNGAANEVRNALKEQSQLRKETREEVKAQFRNRLQEQIQLKKDTINGKVPGDINTAREVASEGMEKFLDFTITDDDYCNAYIDSSSYEDCKTLRLSAKGEYDSIVEAGGQMTMEFVSMINKTSTTATAAIKTTLTVNGVTEVDESEIELVKVINRWYIVMTVE